MKPTCSKYLVSLFFIFSLFAKDIVMLFPAVTGIVQTSFNDDERAQDESENKTETEENVKAETAEFITSHHSLYIDMPLFFLSQRKSIPLNKSFKRNFYGSVLTPPPNQPA